MLRIHLLLCIVVGDSLKVFVLLNFLRFISTPSYVGVFVFNSTVQQFDNDPTCRLIGFVNAKTFYLKYDLFVIL